MTKFFTDDIFLPAKLSSATHTFCWRVFLADEYFLQDDYFVRFFCLKLNALDVKFRFLPYFMTENPTETERNAIICPFFGVLLCFYRVSTINFSKSLTLFQYLMDKKLSAKSIKVFVGKKWRNFLPRNIFCRRNFPLRKFLPIR